MCECQLRTCAGVGQPQFYNFSTQKIKLQDKQKPNKLVTP